MPSERFSWGPAPWGLLALAIVAGCRERAAGSSMSHTTTPAAASVGATGTASTSADTIRCLPSRDGYLRARLRGARNLDVDWQDAQMQCDGSLRPDGKGIRVTFAGQAADHPLRFVFGIAAGADAAAANDVPANVTVIFEGQGELYSTLGNDRCTVDQLHLEPVSGRATLRRVVARGFCVANATAVGSTDGVLISRFDFAGLFTQP